MANEVCTSLGLIDKDLSGKLVLLVEEHGSSASFMIGSLMWNAFKSGSSMCLLALHNSTNHYLNIAKKVGFNMKTAMENKNTVVIEPFGACVDTSYQFNFTNMQNEDNLKRIFFDIKNALSSLIGRKFLIIDDLSDLMCMGANVAQVIAFLQYCRTLQDSDKDLSIIVSTHCSEENDDQKLLSNFIAHIADCRINISGLKTGFSNNVSGSIELIDNLEETNTVNRLFHFKLTDRQIKVFAPGTVGVFA